MTHYDFELTDFALSETGIHLLRNRFNYKTISYQDIDRAVARRAVEIKNLPLAFICGVALTAFAAFQIRALYNNFNDPTVYQFYIEVIVLPVFPAFLGLYFLFKCIKKGPVLEVELGKERHKLRLKEVRRANQVPYVKNYLRERLQHRFIIQDEI